MLILVEKSELFGAVLHHCWDCACQLAVGRPVARRQHLCAERDPRDLCVVRIKPLKLDLKLLRTIYIREHLRHLVDRADTALHLQHIQENLFGLAGDRCSVEKPQRKKMLVILNEQVASKQTAEQMYNRRQTFLGLFGRHTL